MAVVVAVAAAVAAVVAAVVVALSEHAVGASASTGRNS